MKKLFYTTLILNLLTSCSSGFKDEEIDLVLKSKKIKDENLFFLVDGKSENNKEITPKTNFMLLPLTKEEEFQLAKLRSELKSTSEDADIDGKNGEVALEYVAPEDVYKREQEDYLYTKTSLDLEKEKQYQSMAKYCSQRGMFGGCADYSPMKPDSKEAKEVREKIELDFKNFKFYKKGETIKKTNVKFVVLKETFMGKENISIR